MHREQTASTEHVLLVVAIATQTVGNLVFSKKIGESSLVVKLLGCFTGVSSRVTFLAPNVCPSSSFLVTRGVMLSTEQLKQFFDKSQADLKKPLCGSWGSSVTACRMVLAAHLWRRLCTPVPGMSGSPRPHQSMSPPRSKASCEDYHMWAIIRHTECINEQI